MRVFSAAKTATLPKKISKAFNIIMQHNAMIQSRVPTSPSSKPNKAAYSSSKKDLEEQEAAKRGVTKWGLSEKTKGGV